MAVAWLCGMAPKSKVRFRHSSHVSTKPSRLTLRGGLLRERKEDAKRLGRSLEAGSACDASCACRSPGASRRRRSRTTASRATLGDPTEREERRCAHCAELSAFLGPLAEFETFSAFDKAHADQVLRLLFLILCSLELTFDGAENRQVHPEAYLDKSGASGTLAPCWFSCYVAEQNSENMMRHCNCRKLQKQSPNRSRLPCSAA